MAWITINRFVLCVFTCCVYNNALAQTQAQVPYSEPINLQSTYQLSSDIVDLPNGNMEKTGHLSFGLKASVHGQQAELSYQSLPWLKLALQYYNVDNGTDNYQYNLAFSPLRSTTYPITLSAGVLDVLDTAQQRAGFIASTWHGTHYEVTAGVRLFGSSQQFFTGGSWRFAPLKSQLNVQYAQHTQDHFGHDLGRNTQTDSLLHPNRYDGWRMSWEWYFHPNLMLSVNHDTKQHLGLGLEWRANTSRESSIATRLGTLFETHQQGDNIVNVGERSSSSFDTNAIASLGWYVKASWQESRDLTVFISPVNNQQVTYDMVSLHYMMSRSVAQNLDRITYVIVKENIPIYKHTLPVITQWSQSQYLPGAWEFARIKPVSKGDMSILSTLPIASAFRFDTDIINRIWLPQALSQVNRQDTNALSNNISLRFTGSWQWHRWWDITAQYALNAHRNMTVLDNPLKPADTLLIAPLRTAEYREMAKRSVRLERAVLNAYHKYEQSFHGTPYLQALKASLGQLSPFVRGVSLDHVLQPWESQWSFGGSVVLGRLDPAVIAPTTKTKRNIRAWSLRSTWQNHSATLRVSSQVGRFLGGDRGIKLSVKKYMRPGWDLGFWYTVSFAHGQRFVDKGIQLSIPMRSLFQSTKKVSVYSHIREVSGNSGYMLQESDPARAWRDLSFTKGG